MIGVIMLMGLVRRILVIGGLWVLLHLYVGQRLLAHAPIGEAWRLAGWTAVVVLALAPFAVFFAGRARRVPGNPVLEQAGFIAMGLSSLLIVFVLAADLVHARGWLNPGALSAGIVGGDVADGLPPVLRDEVAPLAWLAAPHGKFFVTGNHEYYWDAAAWVRELERLGFSALVNAHRVIRRGTARLVLAGVTDHSASRLVPGHASDPAAAVAGALESDVWVLLAHQPKSAFEARAVGFDLQLSGHTHGGQYFPFNLLVRLFQPFVAGLHRLEEMWLYVSRGTGYWGPRLGAPSEITLIQLTRA